MTSTSDLLASESLLFTLIGVVFSIWYPELSRATDTRVPEHLTDADAERKFVGDALLLKALPLLSADILVVLVFLPDTMKIVVAALRELARSGLGAFRDYDAVQAALVLVTILAAALAAYTVYIAQRLHALRRALAMPQ